MINTTVSTNKNKQINITYQNLLNDSTFLPNWEKIKEIPILKNNFLFGNKSVYIDLWRKFSFKNSLEKYSLKSKNGNILGNMDLKVYKDNVYIINFEIKTMSDFNQIFMTLIQVAVEKAMYNTTEKEVKINLTMPLIQRSLVRKALYNNEFISETEQSEYEKKMFGEEFTLKAVTSFLWQKSIKQMPILINK